MRRYCQRKFGLLLPEQRSRLAKDWLRLPPLRVPPVLHMGSCVDNSRFWWSPPQCQGVGVDISDLPLAGPAPEWMSEKAVSIGAYAVASGIYTVLKFPPGLGSAKLTELLTAGAEGVAGPPSRDRIR